MYAKLLIIIVIWGNERKKKAEYRFDSFSMGILSTCKRQIKKQSASQHDQCLPVSEIPQCGK